MWGSSKPKAQQQAEEQALVDARKGLTPHPQTASGVAAQMQAEQQKYIYFNAMNRIIGITAADPWGEPKRPAIDAAKLAALKQATPRKVQARVPDGITPIVAWRAWKTDGSKLLALGSSGTWEPKKPIAAQCNAYSMSIISACEAQHDAPHFKCDCGIWSFKTLDILVPALKGYEVKVFGEVYLWGRIIETENGFRAQYAYPKELWLLDPTLEQLGYVYNVPIRTP